MSPRIAVLAGSLALLALSATLIARKPDPVTVPGTVAPPDRRRHRLGSHSHARTAALIDRLRRRARDPRLALQASVALARVYRLRRMPREAAAWLSRAEAIDRADAAVRRERALLLRLVREP